MSHTKKIWIVRFYNYGYDYESHADIMAFTSKEDAEEYKKDIDDKSLRIKNELDQLWDEKVELTDRINSRNITPKERIEELVKLSAMTNKKTEEILKDQGDWLCLTEFDEIQIDELDLLVKE